MKIKTLDSNGKEEIIDANPIAYTTQQENFNLYSANVANDHPLFGKVIKVKTVVKQILFRGTDDLGNPQVQVMWDVVLAIE